MLFKLDEGTKSIIGYEDDQACISSAVDEGGRSHHIDVRYHVCREP